MNRKQPNDIETSLYINAETLSDFETVGKRPFKRQNAGF